MVTNEIKTSLKKAITSLEIAEYEFNRPQEDMVALSVCFTARESMNTLMRLFLLSKSVNHNEGKSLSNLLNQCKKLDQQFSSINLSKIYCNDLNHRECEDKYCMATENVTNCITVAKQLKALVLNTLELTESELE